MLFESIMRASIEYPLGQSLLLPSQLQTIERKTYPDIYSKCGYNRYTARKALQGPRDMGGAGFIPLEVVAGTNQIANFLKHWRTPTQQAGKLLHITVAHTQYYSGISKPLFSNPDIKIPYIPESFITTVRAYLKTINSKIYLDNPYIQLPLRENDTAIMDIALEMDYTPMQLKCVNCVRIYLGVFYVSEISTPEGDEIDLAILQFKKHHDYRTTMTRPFQKNPNQSSWLLWERLIDSIT